MKAKMGEKCFIIPKHLKGIKDANKLLCDVLKTEYISEEFIGNQFTCKSVKLPFIRVNYKSLISRVLKIPGSKKPSAVLLTVSAN